MPIFRVHKESNYTTIDNNIFKNKELSWKGTGLLATMLSLPDDWNFSINGLAALKKDKETIVRTALKELETLGYLKRTQIRNEKGKIIDWEYDIYECPDVENPQVEKPHVENHTQLNTNIINNLNNKENIDNKLSIQKKEIFKKPTLEEIEEYCKSRNNNVDSKKFFDFYEAGDWKDTKGNKVKNWKQKIITWERDNKVKPKEEKKSKSTLFFEEMRRKIEEEENEQERST